MAIDFKAHCYTQHLKNALVRFSLPVKHNMCWVKNCVVQWHVMSSPHPPLRQQQSCSIDWLSMLSLWLAKWRHGLLACGMSNVHQTSDVKDWVLSYKSPHPAPLLWNNSAFLVFSHMTQWILHILQSIFYNANDKQITAALHSRRKAADKPTDSY